MVMCKRGDIVNRTQGPKKFGVLSPETLAKDYVILGQETRGVVIWYRATTVHNLTRVGTDARDEGGQAVHRTHGFNDLPHRGTRRHRPTLLSDFFTPQGVVRQAVAPLSRKVSGKFTSFVGRLYTFRVRHCVAKVTSHCAASRCE